MHYLDSLLFHLFGHLKPVGILKSDSKIICTSKKIVLIHKIRSKMGIASLNFELLSLTLDFKKTRRIGRSDHPDVHDLEYEIRRFQAI